MELALTDMTGFSGFSSAARRAGLVSRKGKAKAEAEKIKATSTKARGGLFFGASWLGEHLECSPCGEEAVSLVSALGCKGAGAGGAAVALA
jgi:hypothetical protein